MKAWISNNGGNTPITMKTMKKSGKILGEYALLPGSVILFPNVSPAITRIDMDIESVSESEILVKKVCSDSWGRQTQEIIRWTPDELYHAKWHGNKSFHMYHWEKAPARWVRDQEKKESGHWYNINGSILTEQEFREHPAYPDFKGFSGMPEPNERI